jgi:DNA-binding response OmpR family regulator
MDPVVLRWPAEQPARELLRGQGRPRLLVVDEGSDLPVPSDCLEDFVRSPSDEQELKVRLEALALRASNLVGAPLDGDGLPTLDGDGVLRYGGGWAPLPPVEARLTGALLERYGAVVSRDVLARAGWPGGAPGRNALDVHVLRLRRRLVPVGLAIRTVRSRGYLLEAVR